VTGPDLSALKARIEKATGPDRNPDCDLLVATFKLVAETEPVRKGKPDACWCGQDGAVIRYRDFAAVLTTISDNGGGA
jgi:hypothetical protein